MGELTVQLPLHRHVLSDFTSDDHRRSHFSKGLGVHVLSVYGYRLLSHYVLDPEVGK